MYMQLKLYLMPLRQFAVLCCSFGSSPRFWGKYRGIFCVQIRNSQCTKHWLFFLSLLLPFPEIERKAVFSMVIDRKKEITR